MYLFIAFWAIFGLGYGLALAANAPRETFVKWLDQLAVVAICVLFGPLIPLVMFMYKIFYW